MQILETRVLRGPNLYADAPCFLAVIEAPEWRDRTLADVPGLREQLAIWMTASADGHPLAATSTLPEALAHVLAGLLRQTSEASGFALARPVTRRKDRYEVVAGYTVEAVAREAWPLAVELVESLVRGETPALESALASLQDLADGYAIGPSTRAIIEAAQRRGIPVTRVTEDANLFQLGWGKHARHIQATVTSRTSNIAVDIAQDKDLTKALLDEAGLPVPRGTVVRSAPEAVAAARRLRGPVAVKPLDGNQGKGVSLNLTDPAQIEAAYELAAKYRRSVLVEQYIEGQDYRVLVVGDQVIAVARRLPAHVIADGVRTVAQLVEEENKNPARGEGHLKPMTRIKLDEGARQVLARQGLRFESVPAAGQWVVLKENANLSTGGSAEDVTHLIHPNNALACVRAARKVGLDVAGIDVVCKDIAVPLEQQHGALIEVNAAPGIRMHQHPAKGQPHDVGAAIVDALFPAGAPSRIPVVAVTGTNGKTTTTLAIAHVLHQAGVTTGVTTTEAIYIGGHAIKAGDCTGYWSARTVLSDPAVEAAVLEVARGGMFKRGLAFDACDVGVVLNVQDDHLGQHGAETLGDLAEVKGLIVRTASRAVVLNAEDPLVAPMASRRRPTAEVLFFSLDPQHPVLEAHLDTGGRAVYLRRNMVMLAQGDHRIPLIEVERLPFTLEGRARHNVQNALAVVAALWAIAHPPAQIASGLATFTSNAAQNPGRLNIFHVRDFQVVLDYAHNAASYRALLETTRAMPHRRLIGVVAAPGDRYDEKLREIGRICAGFDELIVREMSDLRGRAPGETPRVILEGVAHARPDLRGVRMVLDEAAAVEEALAMAEAGDLVVIGCADTPMLIAQIQRHATVTPTVAPALAVTWLPEKSELAPPAAGET